MPKRSAGVLLFRRITSNQRNAIFRSEDHHASLVGMASSPTPLPEGFKRGVRPEKILVAMKRAAQATFDAGRWKELAYLLEQPSVLETHPRLLQSLYWGDEDYSSKVFDVLRELVGENYENLEPIAEFLDLRAWLTSNDPKLFAQIFDEEEVAHEEESAVEEEATPEEQEVAWEEAVSDPHVPLEQCERVGEVHSVPELGRHAARIRAGLENGNDSELAIGSAKELLESVLKTVTGDHEQKPTEDIQALLKKAQKELDLDPKGVDGALPGADSLKRTLSNLGQVVVGVAELRTLYGTGHGRSKGGELELAHARLVVNSAISVATFLLEVWEQGKS